MQAVKQDTDTRLNEIYDILSKLESTKLEAKINELEAKVIKLEAEKASQQSDMFKLFESGEKYVMIVNSLENRVKLMEDQIKEGITSKSKELKQQNIVNIDQKCEPPSLQQKEIIMESKRPV